MGLPTAVQHISLAGGMNEKTPREMLPAEQLSFVRNGRWRQPGMIETRLGYTTLATDVLSGGTLPTSQYDRLLVRDDELCRVNERGIYSFCPETVKWAKRDKVPELALYYDRRVSVFANNNIIFTDMAIMSNGVFCLVWQDSGVHAAVFGANGQLLQRARLGDGLRPKVVTVGTKFIIVAGASGASELHAWTIDSVTPTAFTGPTTICADIQGVPPANWDIASCASYFVVIYQNDAADCTVRRFDATLANTHSAASFVGTNVLVVAAYIDPNEADVYLAWHQVAGNRTDATRLNATLAAATWTATAIAGATGDQLTIGAAPSSSNIWIAREGASGCEWVALTKAAGVVVGVVHTTHNVRLASKIFVSPDATAEAFICVYCAVGEADQQGLLCCALGTGSETLTNYRLRPVAKWLTGKVYKNPDAGFELNHLPQVSTRNSGAGNLFYVAHPEMDQGSTTRGSHVGVTRFDMAADNRWARLEDRNTALVAGAMLYQYDGDQLTEVPYAWYPSFTIVAAGDVTSTLPTGSYDYIVVYEWTDARGRIHRSTPSISKNVSITINVTKPQLTIKNLTVTARTDVETGFTSPVALAVYRRNAAAPESPFVRLGSVTAGSSGQILTVNDPLTTTTVFNDSGTGAWSTDNQPQLYSDNSNGVLPAVPPASCRVVARFDGRIWIGGCENSRSIWYSRELVEDEPPLFHENQQIFCEEDVTALANFDSSLLVFSEDSIYVLQGRGPNDRGEGSTYTGLIRLPSEVGCRDWRSLCVTTDGVYFQHRPGEGIYLLDRSLSLSYVGAPVENHATVLYPTVTSAVAVPAEDEIRFSAIAAGGSGRLLVYNTLVKQWMTHELYRALELGPRDAIMWNGAYVFIKDTRVAQQSATYQDYDTAAATARHIPLEITTGDIAMAGPLGRARGWRSVFFGRYLSGSHGLEVLVAFDQSDSYQNIATWTPAEVAAWASLPIEAFEVVGTSRQDARSVRYNIKSTIGSTTPQSLGFMMLALEHGTEQGVETLPEQYKK